MASASYHHPPRSPRRSDRGGRAVFCRRPSAPSASARFFCFHFPWLLTVPELRELYPLPYIRALLHLVLVGSFVLGVLSVCLRRNQDSRRHWHRVDARGRPPGGSQVPVDGEFMAILLLSYGRAAHMTCAAA